MEKGGITNNNGEKSFESKQKKKSSSPNILRVALYLIRRQRTEKNKYNSSQVDVVSKGLWKKILNALQPQRLPSSKSPLPTIHTARVVPKDDSSHGRRSPKGMNSPSASSSSSLSSRYASAVNLQELDKSEGSNGGNSTQILNSPSGSSSFSSRYASSTNLQELDKSEGNNKSEENDNVEIVVEVKKFDHESDEGKNKVEIEVDEDDELIEIVVEDDMNIHKPNKNEGNKNVEVESEDEDFEYDDNGGDEMIDVKAEEFIAKFYEQMRLQRLQSMQRRFKK